MSIQAPNSLYVVLREATNRREKRIAQKELEKIQKSLLPILFSYSQQENKTDSLRLKAKEEYIKWIPKANNGNIFIKADPFFFDKNFPTKKAMEEYIKPTKQVKKSAIILVLILTGFVILMLISLITNSL